MKTLTIKIPASSESEAFEQLTNALETDSNVIIDTISIEPDITFRISYDENEENEQSLLRSLQTDNFVISTE